MPMAAFDTMSVAKRLEREFDVPARQAEGFASVLHENFVGNVATKEDLARTEERLGGEIATVRKDMTHMEERLAGEIAAVRKDLGGEIAAVRKDVEHLEERLSARIDALGKDMTIKLGALMVGGLVIITLLDRVL